MIGLWIVLALVALALVWLVVKGAGRNRDGILEWRFGNSTRFALYDGPVIPSNREARHYDGKADLYEPPTVHPSRRPR